MSTNFERNKDIYDNYVCPNCFYTMDKCVCEVYPAYSATWIDKGIQEHIRILNEKNYLTSYSCESHSNKDSIYISFYGDYGIGENVSVPDGFKYVKRRKTMEYNYKNNISMKEFEREKEKALGILLEWCKSLPERNK